MIQKTEIGMPIAMSSSNQHFFNIDSENSYDTNFVVGRICKLLGTRLDGCNSIIEFMTPGGSVIKSGVHYLTHAGNVELKGLAYFEKSQLDKNKPLYNQEEYEMPENWWKEYDDRTK